MTHPESTVDPSPVAAESAQPGPAEDGLQEAAPRRLLGTIADWLRNDSAWWASSFVFHMLLMCALMLIGTTVQPSVIDEAPSLEGTALDDPSLTPPPIERFEVGQAPLEPTELSTDTLAMHQAVEIDDSQTLDGAGVPPPGGGTADAASGFAFGGAGGFEVPGGLGIATAGRGGVGGGAGTGTNPGAGGGEIGFGSRNSDMQKRLRGAFGGTKRGERAVGAALNWLARHQSPDGSWDLAEYRSRCKDPTCTGAGSAKADAGATSLALLPFLAAGQTHLPKDRGPYRGVIYRGLYWLMRNQDKDNGDLSAGAGQKMYSHGLATITLCEAYGLTQDRMLGDRAQRAVHFIESSQHPTTGGWRYQPGEAGDTSVVAWQVMALKSAQMARLRVNDAALLGAMNWLKLVSKGNGGQFAYVPEEPPRPSMTAAGLLCRQYLGLRRGDPVMLEGMNVLTSNLPDNARRDVYYWYYATQVLHNAPGPEWDEWNRQMRRVLIETQCKEGCATGSWDPEKPSRDKWSDQGGRIFVTSMAALSLEVYYRYLPLYQLDTEEPPAGEKAEPGKSVAKQPERKGAPSRRAGTSATEPPGPATRGGAKPEVSTEAPTGGKDLKPGKEASPDTEKDSRPDAAKAPMPAKAQNADKPPAQPKPAGKASAPP